MWLQWLYSTIISSMVLTTLASAIHRQEFEVSGIFIFVGFWHMQMYKISTHV